MTHAVPPSVATLAAILFASATSHAQTAPTYEVYAIRYATVPSFPVRGLIAGADTSGEWTSP